MKTILYCGALTAALLLSSAASAQSDNTSAAPTTVAATDTAPLIPGGAAGAPAQGAFDAFWASLTGGQDDSTRTASTDTH